MYIKELLCNLNSKDYNVLLCCQFSKRFLVCFVSSLFVGDSRCHRILALHDSASDYNDVATSVLDRLLRRAVNLTILVGAFRDLDTCKTRKIQLRARQRVGRKMHIYMYMESLFSCQKADVDTSKNIN